MRRIGIDKISGKPFKNLKTEAEKMRVENFRGVKNQFLLWDENGNCFFQSYQSIIIKSDANGKIILDEKFWDYSNTTGKYRNYFLGENKAETVRKIQAGIYQLANLN